MIHSFHTATVLHWSWAAFEFLMKNSWYRKCNMDSKTISLHWIVYHFFFLLYEKENLSLLMLLYLLYNSVTVDI